MAERFNIDNTRFVYKTNFSGDPERDRFADKRRKCNILIPDPEQVKDLIKMGVKIRQTTPTSNDDPDTFVPDSFVTAVVAYRNKYNEPLEYLPKVYLVVHDRPPRLLSEETISELDFIRVKNVNVILNAREYDPVNHLKSLYIRTMYVEQDVEDDPYASLYAGYDEEEDSF